MKRNIFSFFLVCCCWWCWLPIFKPFAQSDTKFSEPAFNTLMPQATTYIYSNLWCFSMWFFLIILSLFAFQTRMELESWTNKCGRIQIFKKRVRERKRNQVHQFTMNRSEVRARAEHRNSNSNISSGNISL